MMNDEFNYQWEPVAIGCDIEMKNSTEHGIVKGAIINGNTNKYELIVQFKNGIKRVSNYDCVLWLYHFESYKKTDFITRDMCKTVYDSIPQMDGNDVNDANDENDENNNNENKSKLDYLMELIDEPEKKKLTLAEIAETIVDRDDDSDDSSEQSDIDVSKAGQPKQFDNGIAIEASINEQQ